MQQQFGVFQLVLAQLLARNNPGDPLINLLNPTPQPPPPQQNPEPVQHASALSESQGQSHIAPAQQPLPNDVTQRNARTWYYSLPPRLISFYTEMTSTFATKFSSRRLIRKTTSELMRVKQRDGESLKNFMSRFNDAVLEVSSFDQAVGIAANPIPPKNQNLDWREENSSRKRMRPEQNRGPMSTSTPRFGRPNLAPPQQSTGKPPVAWTPFNLPMSQIFMQIKNKMDLRRPGPMRTAAASRDHTIYCDFHQDHGHTTEQCNSLREQGIQPQGVGHQQGIRNPPNRQGVGHPQAQPPLPPLARIIHMITGGLEAGGMSSKQRKLYVREVKHQNRAQKRKFDDADWKDQPITFAIADFEGVMPSSFNVVINRPTLTEIQAVISQSHLCMKFLTPIGIATLRGNQEVARHCYLTSVTRPQKNKDQPVENPPSEPMIIDKDVFAWTSADMPRIPTSVSQHKLNTNPLKKLVAQKRRLFWGEGLKVIKEEVEKLLQAGFVRRVDYCEWITNLVLVKKANGKWRMCIDYTNLNQACPKDCYPLPNINKLVEVASGNERLSLLDAYSDYHQVPMALEDEEKTSFYASDEIYCYVMMPFGLKNVGATYQKMVTIVFRAQIGRNLEVYIDDIVVKSLKAEDHLIDLEETFNNLRKNRMRLNLAKCIFGVEFGKFLGFMVSRRGIEVNPEKINAMAEMEPLKSIKDIMRLAAQKDESGKQKKFEWNSECQAAFDELKSYLSSPPLLTKANDGEILYLYLSISDEAISSVLVREEGKQQKPVYYTSSVLHGAKMRYSIAEKAALAVVTLARKLRPYFQLHPIIRSTIRAQALADFIVECTSAHTNSQPELDSWILYVDGASSSKGSRLGAILLSPEGYRSEHALKFNFDATNNMAEYEALLLGLQLAIELKVTLIQVYSDSQLVVNQVNSVCEVVDPIMIKYAILVAELKSKFQKFHLSKIPRAENEQADSLSKFVSYGNQSSRSIVVEILDEPSFLKPKIMEISTDPSTPS
ncbi:hypothetical protein SLEP1_g49777 [Rubroshorea leprosula]|uniref:RNase H type-1 domain-containing protein n=1 Tax=Rubroshorea leprosula TaxID=152421 RepID=A0AAV5LXW7_9ROSI|nr:hypothetical protein SLEP1_g49777 [Rubroshorea leprosula]